MSFAARFRFPADNYFAFAESLAFSRAMDGPASFAVEDGGMLYLTVVFHVNELVKIFAHKQLFVNCSCEVVLL